jgi:hypothetical protein
VFVASAFDFSDHKAAAYALSGQAAATGEPIARATAQVKLTFISSL